MFDGVSKLYRYSRTLEGWSQWEMELMEWYNDGYLSSIDGIAEYLFEGFCELWPVDVESLPSEVVEAIAYLLNKIVAVEE
jgi:hypothetical protein